MDTRVLALVLFGLLTACTREGDTTATDAPRASKVSSTAALGGRPDNARLRFAGLPDRGELVAYKRDEPARQIGAYTWRAIELSEDHALRATAPGSSLHFITPDGRPVALTYERHVEHPDGNWTWVGRDAEGKDAVLTFGEKAVYGSIPNGLERALRVYTQAGRIWLVETDRTKLAQIDSPVTRPTRPDFLKPPLAGGAMGSSSAATAPISAAADITGEATAGAITTIDVALGYTTGFANSKGGSSQAVTRLNNLVEYANQAYVNSQMNVRVRLVRTLQVNYVDATDNNVALEELTGYRNGSNIPVPAALQTLRAAGEASGADLVSLVRSFQPQNDSCGIAWLIGAEQTPINQSWAPYGYSVVSDGQYTEGSSTYFCRDETLGHELGHNMGSAHDRTEAAGDDGVLDASEYGRYPYSFGHKTTSGNGNFFTVMAYGDGGQSDYRVFSNPNITYCGGFACGVANQMDNARSITQTAPIIAAFRSATIPLRIARNDINGDGRSDLLWRYVPGGNLQYWLMNGANRASYANVAQTSDFEHLANADFNGDGRVDIAWRGADNRVSIWLNTGAGFSKYSISGLNRNWIPLDAVDINGDGKSDLIWRYVPGGNIQYWLMNGATRTSYRNQAQSTAYQFLAAGDFNGDGRGDIAWRKGDNRVAIWTGNGATFSETSLSGLNRDWTVLDAIDVNGDGRSDLVWRYMPGGNIQYWLMNGATRTGYRNLAASTSYAFLGTGDFNGDGFIDLAWRRSDNRVAIWTGTGSIFSEASLSGLSTSWTLLNRGD
ncbi:FG-GAP-like repeat-containing protein [Lysobacter niabensis]|uniref:FG-GAP-like repeat-containing protein n=1 Tax=Agrilutibacter niabensis TaxID=380628 RepID=UPI0036185AC9